MLVTDYSLVYKVLGTILTGIVIKILDDYIDKDVDYSPYKISWFGKLESAAVPYSIIIFAIAAGFHTEYSVTLMSACYIVGMFHELSLELPTKIKGYHESLVLILINGFLFSIKSTITSLLVIILLQLIDDVVDMKWDRKYGYKNFANKFGKIEVIVVSAMIIILLYMLDLEKLLITAFVALLIYLFDSKLHSITCK